MYKTKNNRRSFLQKLGVSIGVLGLMGNEAFADTNYHEIYKRDERKAFLERYETWVNNYIEVVEKEKSGIPDMENKKRITQLSDEAEQWKSQLKEYIQHEDFKGKYIELSKRFADCITPELEA